MAPRSSSFGLQQHSGSNACPNSLCDGKAPICVPGTGGSIIPASLAQTCLLATSSGWWEGAFSITPTLHAGSLSWPCPNILLHLEGRNPPPSPAPDGAQCSCQRPGTPSLNASGRSPVSCLGASKVLHLPLCEAGSPCPLRGGLASELTKAMSSCRIPWGAASVRGYLAYRAYVLLILRYTVISSVPFCEV